MICVIDKILVITTKTFVIFNHNQNIVCQVQVLKWKSVKNGVFEPNINKQIEFKYLYLWNDQNSTEHTNHNKYLL